MDTILHLAQAWLEQCREEAEFFDSEGEDDTAEKWHRNANEAERIIKRHIDTPVTKIKAHGVEVEVMLSDWDGEPLVQIDTEPGTRTHETIHVCLNDSTAGRWDA